MRIYAQYIIFDFGWGSAQDPTVGAYSIPPDPLGIKGPTSKGGEVEGEKVEGNGRGGKR